MELKNLQYFHSQNYQHYYHHKLKKDIEIKITHKDNNEDYFWRGEYDLRLFGRESIELKFYSQDKEKIPEKQIIKLETFLRNLEKLKYLIGKYYYQVPIGKDWDDGEFITRAYFKILSLKTIDVELWTILDSEHPVVDNDLIDISVEDIIDWNSIDDERAIYLIKEIYENLGKDSFDTIFRINSKALEKRYNQIDGFLSDIIFYSDIDEPDEILKKFKEDKVIRL